MSSLYTHKDYVKARKITVIAAGCYGCMPEDISGVKDTKEKVMTIYLVQQLLDLTDRQLALLFQINKEFMLDKVEQLSIECLMDAQVKELVMAPARVFERLELIEIANG